MQMSFPTKACKECGKVNNFRATACTSCGVNFGKQTRPQNTTKADGFLVGRNGCRSCNTTTETSYLVSDGCPCGTTQQAGFAVSDGRLCGTTRESGSNVCSG